MHEKKRTWLKPEVENGEGSVRQLRPWFCPFGRFNPAVEDKASITRRCAAAGRGTGNNPHAWRCVPKWRNSGAKLKLSATTHLADAQRGIWLRHADPQGGAYRLDRHGDRLDFRRVQEITCRPFYAWERSAFGGKGG